MTVYKYIASILLSLLLGSTRAQMPAFIQKKGAKLDTILVYNPYPAVFTTSPDGKDTITACPVEMMINWEDELRLAARDGKPMDASDFAFSFPAVSQPAIQMYKYISSNMQFPQSPGKGVHGIAVVAFRLNHEGRVVNPTIFRSVSPSIDSYRLPKFYK